MTDELESILKTAAATVFTTMLNMTPEFGSFEADFSNSEEKVAGTVCVKGSMNGIIYFYSSASFARRIACRMLSMSENELEGNEMVNDVIGELTNMLAGQIKLKVHKNGGSCLLTVPTVVRGGSFKPVLVGESIRKSVYLKCPGGHAKVEATLKKD